MRIKRTYQLDQEDIRNLIAEKYGVKADKVLVHGNQIRAEVEIPEEKVIDERETR